MQHQCGLTEDWRPKAVDALGESCVFSEVSWTKGWQLVRCCGSTVGDGLVRIDALDEFLAMEGIDTSFTTRGIRVEPQQG